MSRKIVGITCSTILHSEYGERDVLNRKYARAIENAGGVPIILPVFGGEALSQKYLGVMDGLLLSGGMDIVPAMYGQDALPELDVTDQGRDELELPLVRAAVAQGMPLFGICRGLQTLNVTLGGTLFQDLPTQKPSSIIHYQSHKGHARDEFIHSIEIVPDSRLRGIVGVSEMPVNSLHHQALDKLGEGLVVTATAPDGVIEAAELPAHPYAVAVQFHPEETAPHDERSRRLFETFVAKL
jgi:putative glutamine amidotransferase